MSVQPLVTCSTLLNTGKLQPNLRSPYCSELYCRIYVGAKHCSAEGSHILQMLLFVGGAPAGLRGKPTSCYRFFHDPNGDVRGGASV